MEQNGTIKLTASNGDTLTLTGISDATEPYQWSPSNIAAVRTFATTLNGLTDRSLTVVFNDNAEVRQFYRKVSGSWRAVKLHRKTGGSWAEVKLYRKVSGSWVQVSGPS